MPSTSRWDGNSSCLPVKISYFSYAFWHFPFQRVSLLLFNSPTHLEWCSLRNKCHHNTSEHGCQAKRTSNLAGRNIGSQVEDCFSSIKLEMDVLLENVMKEKGNYSAICWGLFFTSLCNSHLNKLFSFFFPKKNVKKKENV